MSSLGAANSVRDGFDLANSNFLENRKLVRERKVNNKKFFIAISESNIEQVNSLLGKVDINCKDQDGCTPLHWAIETGDLSIIEILTNSGANLHIKNSDHETPLDLAEKLNRLDIVNFLKTSLNSTNEAKVTGIEKDLKHKIQSSTQEQEIVWINPVHGYIYQLKVLMLFLHRGLLCKYSFRLSTEIEEARKFVDLIFEYVEGNKKVYRFLQAKHKFDESKKITVDKLLKETKGDYSLIKYFYSFQACRKEDFFKDGTIKDVIICTNIDFDMNDLKSFGIEIKKIEETDDILDIRSNKKESTRYKFTKSIIKQLKSRLQPEESEYDIGYFLKHLVFAVNQPNDEELGQIIKKEIGKEIGFIDTENAYNTLFMKMMDLILNKSMFLSHEEGKKFFDDLKREIPICFNVHDPIKSFIGRSEYLNLMHKTLENSFVCISGMGGVGKTELARKYIAVHGHEYNNQVVWINAESYRSTVDSFRQLASDKLNICLQTLVGQEKQVTSIIAEIYKFFSKGKSLFIFDNAEIYKFEEEFDCGIDQFLPCLPDNCVKPNVIITSRYQKWPESMKVIVLETFNVEEARAFVEKMLAFGSDEQKEMADELGKRLQFLPLALQQAVAYIKIQKEKLACVDSNFEISNYLEKYSDMTQELLDFELSDDSYSSYDRSVFATCNITFDALKQKESGNDALDILNIMSYFLPDNIPIELLLVFSSDQEKLSSAIGLLKQYSIVSVQHQAVSVHRLVQQVIRIKLQKQNDEVNVLQKALNLLDQSNISFIKIDHILSIWSYARKHSELLEEFARLATTIVHCVRECGQSEEAISIGNGVLELLRKPSENDTKLMYHLLSIRNNIARCIQQKGDYETALKEYQEIHKLQKTILESTHPKVLATKNNISYTLLQLDRNEEALESFYELLDGYRVDLEENHPNILLTKNTISTILYNEGKHEEALSIMQEVYEMHEKVLGIFHEKTILMKLQMSVILNKNKSDDSLKLFEKLCNEQEANLPKNHAYVRVTKSHLADILVEQGKYNEAMNIYQGLIENLSELYGEDYPEVIYINIRIARCLKLQTEYEKAFQIIKNAVDKLRIAFNPLHSHTLRTEMEMLDIMVKQERYVEAMDACKVHLDKQISVSGNIHRKTLRVRRLMLTILYKQKKFNAALELSLLVLYQAESIYGEGHPETLNDKNSVATLYYHTNNFTISLVTLRELLEAQESSLGKDHDDCLKTRDTISEVEQKMFRQSFEEDMNYKFMESGTTERIEANEKSDKRDLLLHSALTTDDPKLIDAILQTGADVFVRNDNGETPLHVAAARGQEEIVMVLLRQWNRESLRDFVDAKTTATGSTALHIAAEKGHYGVVRSLMMRDATFCATDKNGKTPMDLATDPKIENFLKMVQDMFESLKKPNAKSLVRRLKTLAVEESLAVFGTRNDQGLTLNEVATLKKQKQVLAQIVRMLRRTTISHE